MATEYPVPKVLAMVVCDKIWQDPGTGKYFILGTVTRLRASSFPVTHPIISVYLVLTDGRGKTPLTIRLVKVNSNEIIAEASGEATFADPWMVIEANISLENTTFEEAGEYRFKLLSRETILIERKFFVQLG